MFARTVPLGIRLVKLTYLLICRSGLFNGTTSSGVPRKAKKTMAELWSVKDPKLEVADTSFTACDSKSHPITKGHTATLFGTESHYSVATGQFHPFWDRTFRRVPC